MVYNMRNFVDRLRNVVNDAGTIKILALKSGITEKSISNYLHNGTDPGLKNLLKIQKASGVSIDWLATGDGPKFQYQRTTSQIDSKTQAFEARIIWNVAYFLAEESDYIDADPTSLAETLISLSEFISKEEDLEAEGTGKVMSFAAAQIKKASHG